MDPRYAVGLIAGLVMAWFAIGIIYNLRHGEAVLRWMQGGLPKIGERTSLRWLGTSVAELVIEHARAPFRRVETLIVLAPRDVPWMWLWARLRGRRDILVFRCQLASPPKVALELADPASWTGRMALNDLAREGWELSPYARVDPAQVPGPARPLPLATSGQQLALMAPFGLLGRAQEALPPYAAALERLSPCYWRLGIRRDPGSLEIHIPLPDPHAADAAELFEALRDLARAGAGQ